MTMSVLHILIMGSVFLYMFNKAQFLQTRLVALVPLATLVVDSCVFGAGMASAGLFAVSEGLRIAILLCCVGAMKRDARLARARKQKRAYHKLQFHNAMQEMPVVALPERQYA